MVAETTRPPSRQVTGPLAASTPRRRPAPLSGSRPVSGSRTRPGPLPSVATWPVGGPAELTRIMRGRPSIDPAADAGPSVPKPRQVRASRRPSGPRRVRSGVLRAGWRSPSSVLSREQWRRLRQIRGRADVDPILLSVTRQLAVRLARQRSLIALHAGMAVQTLRDSWRAEQFPPAVKHVGGWSVHLWLVGERAAGRHGACRHRCLSGAGSAPPELLGRAGAPIQHPLGRQRAGPGSDDRDVIADLHLADRACVAHRRSFCPRRRIR